MNICPKLIVTNCHVTLLMFSLPLPVSPFLVVQYTFFLLHPLKNSHPSTKFFSSAMPLFKPSCKNLNHPFCGADYYLYICRIDYAMR